MRIATSVALILAASVTWPKTDEASLQALKQLRAARTAYTLQVGQQEAGAILEALAGFRKVSADYAKWAADQWKASGAKVKQAVEAWAAGRQPSADASQAAIELLRSVSKQEAALQKKAEEAALAALKALGDKAAAVETPEQADARRLAERRFWGARNAAEAVIRAGEALRLLMPDDYELVRVAEAERLAVAITGGQAPPGLVSSILAMLDRLVDMPARDLVARREELMRQIASALNLPPAAAVTPAVAWDEFVQWVSQPGTWVVLSSLAGKTAPAAAEVPAEFKTQVARLKLLGLVFDLQMTPPQVQGFRQLCVQIAADVEAARRDEAGVAQQALELLPPVREALSKGKALEGSVADKLQRVLGASDAIRSQLRVAMAGRIRQLRRLLSPQQRSLIDWIPPGDVLRLLPPEARVERLRERAALIQQALDFLNRLKYQTAKRYMNLKVSQSQEFVAAFIAPDSPDYDRAMAFVLDLVTEARMVPREDWEGGADVEFATRLMRGLGVLRDSLIPPPTGRELYDWQALYELFTAPGAAAMFVAGAPAKGEGQ